MKHLVIITQKVDANDDLLGFFVDWIREFAKHVQKVSVLTLAKGTYNLSANVEVYSLGKEAGAYKIVQLFRFYRCAFKVIPSSDGVFAHMSPLFTIASWPIAALFGKKIVLWYLHRSVTKRLRLAEKLSFKIATATLESLRLRSKKIGEVGHGINAGRFSTVRSWSESMHIISVGRISPIKNYETLLQAMALIPGARVIIVGKPYSASDERYLATLEKLAQGLNIQDRVTFAGFVPYTAIAPYYQKASIAVNLTPPGGIDKSVLEAMAAGCLALTSNTVFQKYFGEFSDRLIFEHGNVQDLAQKIQYLVALSSEAKEVMSRALVKTVQEQHSIPRVVSNILNLFS